MVLNYFVRERKQVKEQLLEFVKKNKDRPLKQVVALFSLKTGFKTDTIERYIEELVDAELIKIEGGNIV